MRGFERPCQEPGGLSLPRVTRSRACKWTCCHVRSVSAAGWSLGCIEKAQVVTQFGWKVLGAPLAPPLAQTQRAQIEHSAGRQEQATGLLVLHACARPSAPLYLLDVASGPVFCPCSSPTLARGMNSLLTKLSLPSLAFPHLQQEAASKTGPRCPHLLKVGSAFPKLTGHVCCVPKPSCLLASSHLFLGCRRSLETYPGSLSPGLLLNKWPVPQLPRHTSRPVEAARSAHIRPSPCASSLPSAGPGTSVHLACLTSRRSW